MDHDVASKARQTIRELTKGIGSDEKQETAEWKAARFQSAIDAEDQLDRRVGSAIRRHLDDAT